MPIAPAVAAAAIAGGSSVLGQGINAYAQGKMNKTTRKWNEKMYARQRADSLADWTMQNEYNSPQAQMARLKAAGLNPALVYQNGATHTAQAVRSSDTPQWNPKAPQFDLGSAAVSGISAYYDSQIKDVTTDNLKAQNAVLVQEALLKAAQIGATIASTNKTNFDTDLAKEIRKYSVEAARLGVGKAAADLRRTEIGTDIDLARNEREAMMNSTSIQEAVHRMAAIRQSNLESQERILKSKLDREIKSKEEREKINHEIARIRQEISNMVMAQKSSQLDQQLKQLDIDLKKKGLQPTDELWQRAIIRFWTMIEKGGAGPLNHGIIPLK